MARRTLRITLPGLLWALAALCLLTAAGLAGLAYFGGAEGEALRFAALGELWFRYSRGSLNLIQAVTERYIAVFVWDSVIFPVLQQPAVLVFALPGVLFALLAWLLGRRRRA